MKKMLCAVAAALVLGGCGESKVNVNYKVSAPVDVELYAEGYFSTIDLKGEEKMGTVTAAYANLTYSSVGDSLKLHREYVMDKSRGYLKNYMPSELAWRVKSVDMTAIDREVKNVEGLDDGYDSLLSRIPMPEVWRKQLLNPDYKPHLKRLEKHRWEMDHMLLGEVPTKGNITQMLKDQGRLNFALIQVDSVVVKGFENRDHRHCLDYIVYLKETENFPYYIWEQHVNSGIVPEKFRINIYLEVDAIPLMMLYDLNLVKLKKRMADKIDGPEYSAVNKLRGKIPSHHSMGLPQILAAAANFI